ncbi:uncharacterized protein LOC120187721 [Hibiscus syriacus]|uniref:uncharacterized protein LOC120187721 n=1 Tax=Hibiscus syriacus TaxID=106335 RepID=UPI00192243D0|nr:uncharacterized protein LOC120187721 [Hibiscus syriacus]
MGCGVSKFDNTVGGEDRQRRQLRVVHRKNSAAVVIPKPLPVDGDGDEDSKGKSRSDERGGDNYHKDESEEDDGTDIPHSLSFRVYCNSSFDDNTHGDCNANNMMGKHEGDAGNRKGSNTRSRRKSMVGKGLKCILRS